MHAVRHIYFNDRVSHSGPRRGNVTQHLAMGLFVCLVNCTNKPKTRVKTHTKLDWAEFH